MSAIRQGIATALLVFLLLQLLVWIPVSIPGNATAGTEYENFNFIAYGDTRSWELPDAVSPLHEEIINAYLQHDPDFIVHTGDMVLTGGLWYQWIAFNESIAAVREAGIPFYGVVGNHEKYTDQWYVYDEEFINYRTYFDFPHVIDEPGENELYYSFDYERVHFVFLNTEDYFDDREDGSNEFNCSAAQMNWFIADLSETHSHDFIVVSFHRTAWSIREDRPDRWWQAETVRDDFHDIFVQNGVDLVLMGHDHLYYHTIRDGIHYVTTGGGGAPLAGIDPDPPIWQEIDIAYSVYHYCHIEVNRTHVTVTALTPDDTALESFAMARASEVDTTPPTILVLSPENETFYPKNNITLTFTVDEPTDWMGYSLDGQANVTITGNTTLTSLLDGSHYVVVYANDTVGNMGTSNMVYFTVDTTPPNITDVSQIPLENNVQPEDEVKVNATVIDVTGGVERVALNYTNGNGTWMTIEMTSLSVHPNVWSAIIPSFPYGTNVTYIVTAEDAVGNAVTSEELGYATQYQVVPEFPSFLVLPLFIMTTLLALIAQRRQLM